MEKNIKAIDKVIKILKDFTGKKILVFINNKDIRYVFSLLFFYEIEFH